MPVDLELGLVRILDQRHQTVGAGFVVRGNDGTPYIATCAHVVLDSLEPESREAPETVSVQYVSHPGDPRIARVEKLHGWRPVERGDIAVLRIVGDLPDGVEALPLGHAEHAAGQEFETIGFPDARVEGLRDRGTIIGMLPPGEHGPELQLGGATAVTAGFSGGPVLALKADRVVGMVSSISRPDRFDRLTETAFVIPAEAIHEACVALVPSDVRPYRGLEAYTEHDARFYFGQSGTVERLMRLLDESPTPRVIALFGASGSGKSSLIQAGLIARLAETDAAKPTAASPWTPKIIRPAEALSLDPGAGLEGARAPRGVTEAWLPGRRDDERLLLVIDQFEELFTAESVVWRTDYVRQLVGVIDDEGSEVVVLLVMRSDFYGRLGDETSALQTRLMPHARVDIPPTVDRTEITTIVTQPAEEVGLSFEEGLVADIVRHTIAAAPVPADPGLARTPVLPLLGEALDGLWRGRRDGRLTHDAYGVIEGVEGALPRRAARAYRRFSDPEQALLARRILTDLVHLGDPDAGVPDTRRRRDRIELVREPSEAEDVEAVIARLASERLVVTAADDGVASVELIHDALITQWGDLKTWVRDNRVVLQGRDELERQARAWDDGGHDEGGLLRGTRLEAAEELLSRPHLVASQVLREFVATSIERRRRDALAVREQLERERRSRERLRRAVAGLIVLLVLTVVAGGFAVVQADEARRALADAEHQTQVATSRRLAAQAMAQMDDRLDLSLLLAVEAYNASTGLDRAESSEARAALLAGQLAEPGLQAILTGHTGSVTSVGVSSDGSVVASASDDGMLMVWDGDGGHPLGDLLTGRGDSVQTVAVSPDGSLVASGGGDSAVTVWDVASREPVGPPIDAHREPVTSLAFDPNGRRLASSSLDGTIRFWDVATHDPSGKTLRGGASIERIAFSPDGSLLASLGERGAVIWDVKRREPEGKPFGLGFDEDAGMVLVDIAFSPDGETVATGSMFGEIVLWDPSNGEERYRLQSGLGSANGIAFSPDGALLVSGHDSGDILMWDLADPSSGPRQLSGHAEPVLALAFSRTGSVLASGGQDQRVSLWDVSGTGPLGTELVGPTGNDSAAIVFSPAGSVLASSTYGDGDVTIWDIAALEPSYELRRDDPRTPTALAFSPNGINLVGGGEGGAVTLWDLTDPSRRGQSLGSHGDDVIGVAFSPDGTMVASIGLDYTIQLWDVASRRPLGDPLIGRADVSDVAFSPDGSILASSSSSDDTLILWDVATHEQLRDPLVGHTAGVESVAFSPDGSILASGGADSVIRLWDPSTGEEAGEPLRGHADGVQDLAFSPDGSLLATAGVDGSVRLWDVADRALLSRPLVPGDGSSAATDVAFARDGTLLGTIFGDRIILWDLDPASWLAHSCERANRNMSTREWAQFFPTADAYRLTCVDLPPGEGVASDDPDIRAVSPSAP